MYRFGDSTPFPLSENFIDTISAVVDAAVELYRAESLADQGHRRAREVRKAAADELRRLDALSALLGGTLAPLVPPAPTGRVSDQAAAQIADLGRDVVARARAAVVQKRDSAMQQALTSRHRELTGEALGRLFLARCLPDSEWTAEWSAQGDHPELLLTCQASKALAVELIASVEADERFGGPLKVTDLCPTLASVVITDAAGDKRRTSERLGQLSVLELDLSSQGCRMVLGRPGKKSVGLAMARRHGHRPVASWLTATGEVKARALLDDPALDALSELATAVEGCLDELVARRSTFLRASIHGHPLDQVEHPAALAEELLAIIAPLTREMRLRSKVPGELILKRDLGGDRREELFVPRSALNAKFADLPDEQRRAFEAIGLGSEATCEFRVRLARGTGGIVDEADDNPDMTEPTTERPVPRRQRDIADQAAAVVAALDGVG